MTNHIGGIGAPTLAPRRRALQSDLPSGPGTSGREIGVSPDGQRNNQRV